MSRHRGRRCTEIVSSFEVVKAFQLVDSDHDGLISYKEFYEALQRIGGLSPCESSVASILKLVDSDGSGMINMQEYCDFFKKVEDVQRMAKNREVRLRCFWYTKIVYFLIALLFTCVFMFMQASLDGDSDPQDKKLIRIGSWTSASCLVHGVIIVFVIPLVKMKFKLFSLRVQECFGARLSKFLELISTGSVEKKAQFVSHDRPLWTAEPEVLYKPSPELSLQAVSYREVVRRRQEEDQLSQGVFTYPLPPPLAVPCACSPPPPDWEPPNLSAPQDEEEEMRQQRLISWCERDSTIDEKQKELLPTRDISWLERDSIIQDPSLADSRTTPLQRHLQRPSSAPHLGTPSSAAAAARRVTQHQAGITNGAYCPSNYDDARRLQDASVRFSSFNPMCDRRGRPGSASTASTSASGSNQTLSPSSPARSRASSAASAPLGGGQSPGGRRRPSSAPLGRRSTSSPKAPTTAPKAESWSAQPLDCWRQRPESP